MAVKTRSELKTDITTTLESGVKNSMAEIRAVQTDTIDSAVFPADLAEVAFSGDYEDLSNKPAGGEDVSVSDDAYGSGWNGVVDTAPSQNAVYDKIEALDAEKSDVGHTHTVSDITDFDDGDYATSAQGALADTAVQPGDLATVATTGDFADLTGSPVSDTAFGSGWNGDQGVPTKNAVYDKLVVMISNDAYASGWNGVSDIAPSKDAVYDKIESLSTTLDTAVQETVTVSAGTGLTGGGDLSENITLSLDTETIASLALADSAVQPGDIAVSYVTVSATRDTTTDDNNKVLRSTSASEVTITVIANTVPEGFQLRQTGAGQVNIVAGSGVVINVEAGLNASTRGQYALVELVPEPTVNNYILVGSLETA